MNTKKIMAMLSMVVLTASITACGSSGENSTVSSSQTGSSASEDTITIMVPPITGTYVEDLNGWISDYKESHPNISVEVIATSWDEHSSKLMTMANAGEAPDIAEVPYSAIGTYSELGVAIDVAQYLESDRLADYDANALDYMTLEDTVYGLPLYITIQALGGNREMLEAAGADVEQIQTKGWSYDDFLKVIATGTTDDRYGFVFANAGVTTADFVSVFGVSAGISSSFTEDLKYAYTSDNMLQLLTAVETMTGSGYMPDYSVEAGQRLVMLETGQTMLMGKAMPLFENMVKKNVASLQASDGEAAEGSIEMEYVFLPVPTMDGAKESTYGVVDGMIALRNNRTTEEHLQNVVEFMDYLCSGERVAAVDNTLYLSSVTESGRKAQESYTLDQSEANAKATERAISLVTPPTAGITAEMSANAQTMMDETIVPKFQSLLAGEATAQETYDAICASAYGLFGEENCASGWIE